MKNQSGSRSDKVFDAVLLVVLTLILLITLYPVYFVLISSFSDPVAVAGGDVTFWPVGFTLEGYQTVLKDSAIVRGFFNSVVYTVVGVLVNLFLTLPTAYALSRRDFPARKPILIFYMITMFVSGGMMPTYLVVQQTGLLDTMWALILPGAVNVYNLLTARAFFRAGIPEELLEAARIDGCNNTRFSRWRCRCRERWWPLWCCITAWRIGTAISTRCCIFLTRTNGRCKCSCAAFFCKTAGMPPPRVLRRSSLPNGSAWKRWRK